ncbi:MAG TPA: LutB/LldF family L-lactate oxidation iron-sulfur protein [Tepidisphaeraceae bacterium]|jgi:L-lactate dehydrogenase complex protein LldF|nr:LutB/LldF family L-lactate oxidation iron-sulfur protein [Tepidisphaeraceae bacterium]
MATTLEGQPLDENTKHFLQEAHASHYDFHSLSVKAAGDKRLKRAVSLATVKQATGRENRLLELPDSDKMRTVAGEIKQHTLDHLDYYLEQFIAAVEKDGGHVHLASTGAEAKRIITDLVREKKLKLCVKAKSMVSEEIELTHALENLGMEVVETDLGEFIVQIDHDKPSHLVQPIIHKDRASIAKVFSEYFGTPYNDNAEAMTKQAREYLRDKFRRADMGITGGNFLVAEAGKVCIVTNEGNGRLTGAMPRVLVSLVGIEKLVPRMTDLAVMLKLLARSSTGQHLTVYNSIFGGPRKAGEKDGPEEFHVVLLDNGRSEILGSRYRETLRCIRCAACLNVCPIYRKIGGHSYGSVYPGPIGALITPLFEGLSKFKDLPQASSLCGACYHACPVKINIPLHLINMREDIVSRKMGTPIERMIYRVWAWGLKSPFIYKWINTFQKLELRRRARGTGWVHDLPEPGSGWTEVRDMPAPAKKTFHELWKKRGKQR